MDLLGRDWVSRARRLMPGGVNSPVRGFRHVGCDPVYFRAAKGCFLEDVDGKKYVDYCLSFGPLIFGHSPAEVVSAVASQIASGTTFGACHPYEVELAELILKAYPSLSRVRLVNSGTEAVMTAIRIARGATGRTKILKFEGCYHGHSDGLLVKSGSGVLDLSESSSLGVPSAIAKETLVARLDRPESYKKIFEKFAQDIACVIVEPIPANDGLYVPSSDQIRELFALAKACGSLAIADEVISGFRVALGGVTELYDLKPDLVTLGKVIGGGFPLAAVAGTEKVMATLAPEGAVYQAGTLSGNVLACLAGAATVRRLMEEMPYEKLGSVTEAFCMELEKGLKKKRPTLSVKRFGSLFWISFGNSSNCFPASFQAAEREGFARFYQGALARGIYLAPSPYEVCFVCTEHTEKVLEQTLESLCSL